MSVISMNAIIAGLLVTLGLASTACSLVRLDPGAEKVRLTTNPAELTACTYVGVVNGAAANISTNYAHQMQNQALSMDADTVFQSGNGGIAYRCKPKLN
jgi:hypothetical protein